MTTAVNYIKRYIVLLDIKHFLIIYFLKWLKRFYLSNRWSVDCIINNIFGASIIIFADVSIIQNGVGVNRWLSLTILLQHLYILQNTSEINLVIEIQVSPDILKYLNE